MKIAVLGFGGVGRATVATLLAQGDQVRIAHHRSPERMPAEATFLACDALDAEAVKAAARDMDAVVFSVAFPYATSTWRRDFPVAIGNVIDACEAAGARFVFVDNLYMYGAQHGPLRESTRLTEVGGKAKVRADITRQWLAAHNAGRIKGVAVRGSDYYGPDAYGPVAPPSVFGLFGIERMMAGKSPILIHSPDIPHDFTYVPDFARAVASLAHAPDEDYGRAWHVPNAPIKTPRQIFQMVADIMEVPLKLTCVPEFMLKLAGPFNPLMSEAAEMKFQRDRPYRVDTSDFAGRFWRDATPFERGLRATVEFYQSEPRYQKLSRPRPKQAA